MKSNNHILTIIIVTIALISFAIQSNGKVIFSDNFDLEAPDEGSPDNFFSFGTSLTSSVVNPRNVATPPNATILTMSFFPGTWGGGMLVHKFEPTNYEGAILSASICASLDLSQKKPIFAFRVEDEDGTIVRANTANMFAPSQTFTEFSLPISAITQIDEHGANGILNLNKIVSFGFCFYNLNNDVNGIVNFFIDDVTVTIPDNDLIITESTTTVSTR